MLLECFFVNFINEFNIIDKCDILDVNLSHFNKVESKDFVSFILLRGFRFIKSFLCLTYNIQSNCFESFIYETNITIIFKFGCSWFFFSTLTDVIDIRKKTNSFLSFLHQFNLLNKISRPLLSHNSIVSFESRNWSILINDVWNPRPCTVTSSTDALSDLVKTSLGVIRKDGFHSRSKVMNHV